MVAFSISKIMPYEIISTFIHLLAMVPLNHDFKLKILSSTLCLIILDVIIFDCNYIRGQQVMAFGQNLDSCLFLYSKRIKWVFLITFLNGCKSKIRIVFHNLKLYKIQILVFKHKVLLECSHTSLQVADGHFCATIAEMSSYRDPMAHKT